MVGSDGYFKCGCAHRRNGIRIDSELHSIGYVLEFQVHRLDTVVCNNETYSLCVPDGEIAGIEFERLYSEIAQHQAVSFLQRLGYLVNRASEVEDYWFLEI